jgi:hypothetical protein
VAYHQIGHCSWKVVVPTEPFHQVLRIVKSERPQLEQKNRCTRM